MSLDPYSLEFRTYRVIYVGKVMMTRAAQTRLDLCVITAPQIRNSDKPNPSKFASAGESATRAEK